MEAPYNIQNFRREKCERCPTPCEFQKNVAFRMDGDNACPQGRWGKYETFTKSISRIRGAGDVVAAFAQPVAGAIDKVLKTNVKGCAACKRRKEMLNHLIPWGQKDHSKE